MPSDKSVQEPGGTYLDEIRTLTSMTGFPESEVRSVFEKEFARLSSGATVDTYLTVRTISNVLTILRGRSHARHDSELSR